MEDTKEGAFKVCQIIRDKRRHLVISQHEMGKKLGITQEAYSTLEKGTSKLTIERLLQIAEIFNVEPAYFFDMDVLGLKERLIERNIHVQSIINRTQFEPNLPDLSKTKTAELRNIIKTLKIENNKLKIDLDGSRKLNDYQDFEIKKISKILREILNNASIKIPATIAKEIRELFTYKTN